MGCSFSDESSFIPTSPLTLYPTQSPVSALYNYLRERQRSQRLFSQHFEPIFRSFNSHPASVVDITLDILRFEECILNNVTRKSLLVFLRQLLMSPIDNYFHYRFFNDLIVQPDQKVRGRIERLKILLLETNEETMEGKLLLKFLAYKSILFEKVNHGIRMQYTIVLDKSGSLTTKEHGKTRWQDSREAIEHLTEAVEGLCPNGMNLYMFSTQSRSHPKYLGIRDCETIKQLFERTKPGGTTDLAGVLHQVFHDHHTLNGGQPEHVLVITDGEPDSQNSVVRELVTGINSLRSEHELGITFLQVGCCEKAAHFLHKLQDCLTEAGARWNIIDCLTFKDYQGKRLCDFITQSVVQTGHQAQPSSVSFPPAYSAQQQPQPFTTSPDQQPFLPPQPFYPPPPPPFPSQQPPQSFVPPPPTMQTQQPTYTFGGPISQ